jgi:protein-L-isoaspartate O-methyltransferase
MRYDLAATHRQMVRDAARTDAFRDAIARVVRPGDAVLDVGAGSGILSLFAAQAGARVVYAVERTEIAGLAADLAARNGYAHVVRVVRADAERVWLPERVDVLVSEWLGTIGVDENLLAMVVDARDRWLRPGGALVPARVTAWCAPARVPQRTEQRFFHERPYDLDLAPLAEASVHELLCSRRRVRPDDLAATPAAMWTTDVATATGPAARGPWHAELTFTAPADAPVAALCAWFDATLAPGIVLSNAPDAPDTHWGQLLLPLRRERRLGAGEPLDVRVTCIPDVPGLTHLVWSVRHAGGAWEHHDTRLPFDPEDVMAATVPPRAPAYRPPARPAASPAAPPDAAPATPLAMRAPSTTLSRFLAALAVDPARLRDFIRDPMAAMTAAGLSDAERAALVSRDQARIQQALYAPGGAA